MEENEEVPVGGTEEVVEEAAEEAAEEARPGSAEELLADVFGEAPPDSIRALEEAAERNGADYKVTADQFENLDIVAKQVLANQRRSYTQKMQELGGQRKELQDAAEQLKQDRARFAQERAQMMAMFKNNDKLAALLTPEEHEEQYDSFTEEGRRKLVAREAKAEAKSLLGEFLKIMEGTSDEYAQAAEQHLQQLKMEERKAEVTAFIAERPDFMQFADHIEVLVQKHDMPVERAYKLAKLEHGAPVQQQDPIVESRRRARQRTTLGGGDGKAAPTLQELKRRSSY